ncbi:MAG: HIT domain-containing protein [Acidobacteria bacterium]|nr:HIT domain-containing protein [Acidobacteriota bacterium]
MNKVDDAGGCVFCAALSQADQAPLVVYRDENAFVILNMFPYNSGHLMIVPARHIATLGAASPAERARMIELTSLTEAVLSEVYRPQGLNVGMNLGRAAGAGIVDHLHIHVVPRWNGDTNFVSVVGEVRVLPEDLEQSASRLRPVFERLGQQQVASSKKHE